LHRPIARHLIVSLFARCEWFVNSSDVHSRCASSIIYLFVSFMDSFARIFILWCAEKHFICIKKFLLIINFIWKNYYNICIFTNYFNKHFNIFKFAVIFDLINIILNFSFSFMKVEAIFYIYYELRFMLLIISLCKILLRET